MNKSISEASVRKLAAFARKNGKVQATESIAFLRRTVTLKDVVKMVKAHNSKRQGVIL